MVKKTDKDKPTDKAWETVTEFEDEITLEQLILRTPYRESKDKHGHSITAGARVPESVMRKVEQLRELAGSPYQINSDVIRDAVFLGLQILHIRYKRMEDWAVIKELADVAAAASEGRRIKDETKEMLSGLAGMLEEGDNDKAAEMLSRFIIVADRVTDDWRRGRIFSQLLTSATARALLPYCTGESQGIMEANRAYTSSP